MADTKDTTAADLKARAEQIGVDESVFVPAEDQPAVSALKAADQAPGLPTQDAEIHDPPLRSNRPQSELIASLAVGSGQHTPVTDPDIDPAGRYNPGWDEGVTVTTAAATTTTRTTATKAT